MRRSLQCLYSQEGKPQHLETQLSESLETGEPVDVFHNTYEMEQQRSLEQGAYASALEVWKHEMNEAIKRGDIYAGRLGIQNLAWDWVQAMAPTLESHIESLRPKDINSEGQPLRQGVDKDTENARMDHIWLSALPVKTLCTITVMEMLQSQIQNGRGNTAKASSVVTRVGKAVEQEMRASDLVRKENKGLHPKNFNIRQLFAKKRHVQRYATKFHSELIKGANGGVTYWPFEWRQDVRMRVIQPLILADV